MILEISALVVSVISAVLAIISIIQAIVLRRQTKKETTDGLSFITNLVANSAADPEIVRRLLEDYGRIGEWRTKVSRRPDGKYGLDYTITVGIGKL